MRVRTQDSGVKALALATSGAGSFIELTGDTVSDRTYPLTRTVYVYLGDDANHGAAPAVKEFMRYVLGRDGQHVARQDVYPPLTQDMAQGESEKLR